MAGIYLHIPFCRKACHYCNFHFSTSMGLKPALVNALLREIESRAGEAATWDIHTIYFGGGTPSLLDHRELEAILASLRAHYRLAADLEITLEANPDDLSPDYLSMLKALGVHRLSVGIQSFREEDLRYMNRSHDAGQARRCLRDARDAGFYSLNADLIYGTPGLRDEELIAHAEELIAAGADHLSAYALTVEPRTALAHMVLHGKAEGPQDEQAARQFQVLKHTLAKAGFVHYEISNWCLPGKESRHNTSYWLGQPYLGMGPAAHSFDGEKRSWNVAHNPRYIEAWMSGRRECEWESLRPAERYNEYILTRLRTRWGCRLGDMDPAYQEHFLGEVQSFLDAGQILLQDGVYTLSDEGQLYADRIAAALFADPD